MREWLAWIGVAAVIGCGGAADAADNPADRGEYLARAANCVSCHSVSDGKPFAGGLKMAVPFLGAIYSTNITPDKATGIGDYSFEDFERAVRRGIAKDGHMLYPAMPYPSYVKISDEDTRALYAFFMSSVPAAAVSNKPTEIKWPLNIRWFMKAWNLGFFYETGFQAEQSKDQQWNRGAYLVEGLGHCGACHTSRGVLFQEKALNARDGKYLAGAELDDWQASDLRSDPIAGLGRWSAGDIAAFLKTGHNSFGTAFGTMTEVVNNSTQYLSNDDVEAIAVYLKSLPSTSERAPGPAPTATNATATADLTGEFSAAEYGRRCGSCHGNDAKGAPPHIPPLAANPVISADDPVSLINIVLNGSPRVVVGDAPDTYRMPGLRQTLRDGEIARLLTFVRQTWGSAGEVSAEEVKRIREKTSTASDAVVILRMK